MSESLIVRRGGGDGSLSLYAIIAVTYPSGLICACSNGTKTLTAKDTSGKALFNVPAGEWEVSCTDGDKTKSVTVNITTEGQVESVTLSYDLTIFSEGTGFADGLDVTVPSGNLFNVTNDSITMRLNAGIGYINVKSVDVSSYSTIWVDAKVDRDDRYKEPVVFGIGVSEANHEALKSIPHNTSRNTFSLDISSFTGEKTLFLGTNCGGGTVYNWWLA